MKIDVINLDAKKTDEIYLDESIFGLETRKDILTRVVNWQLAKRRSGNHKIKGISEISGTTKKPFRQKGTGRARQGSMRATHFRGGQTVHGPVVRSHRQQLTKKFRKLGLRIALSTKFKDGQLIVIDEATADRPKTKPLAAKFKLLGWLSLLVIDGEVLNKNFAYAVRNIPLVDLLPQQGANVYDILRRETLVLTKVAVEQLEIRLK
ncbi:ribosomal L4/L1 family protein [Candidatus Endolissoclinum faulkneri L2]|uniref:Large ribosomal subunit protein uL4 n=1 Tax=Candidatus Endolissoclinum faulkneri L2 TaxID=1193729 RepID=K7YLU5_9PROT|nr:50S ribosomal protein L4 [Candidatus Endolissoclinum faulkneri]AFX98437.1 ribosomal L4/L1 family protein [Candidatus Endolissoclinum faulkneri L2]